MTTICVWSGCTIPLNTNRPFDTLFATKANTKQYLAVALLALLKPAVMAPNKLT